jgi:hypothetical protein
MPHSRMTRPLNRIVSPSTNFGGAAFSQSAFGIIVGRERGGCKRNRCEDE